MSQPITRLLKPFASLRLTVVLLALAIFLVFASTLAQIDRGIWHIVREYYRSFFVWIEFQIFLPRALNVPGGFYFPGGFLIGGVMLVNLLAAHAVRFKIKAGGTRLTVGLVLLAVSIALILWFHLSGFAGTTLDAGGVFSLLTVGALCYVPLLVASIVLFAKRMGIMLIHASLILLLVGELLTGLLAVEMQMRINEGQTVNYAVDIREPELAVVTPMPDGTDQQVAIPRKLLVTGATITHPDLPFDIRILKFMENSILVAAWNAPPEVTSGITPATLGDFTRYLPQEEKPVPGTKGNNVDIASAMIELIDKADGRSLGTMVTSVHAGFAQAIWIDGREHLVELRFRRYYKPYEIHLYDFAHDVYTGTDTPRNFSSHIRLIDPSAHEDREVNIRMNQPLRYAGQTFYQASFDNQDRTTILQVVDNPAWLVPYVACAIGTIGLTSHFCLMLFGYLRRRAA